MKNMGKKDMPYGNAGVATVTKGKKKAPAKPMKSVMKKK